MAKIKTYPVITPTRDDLLIGTNGADSATKNFEAGAVADLVLAAANVFAQNNTFPTVGIADGTPRLDAGGGRGHDYYLNILDTITDMVGSFPTRHFIHGVNSDLTLADTSGLGKIDAHLEGYRGSVYIDPSSTTAPSDINGLNFGVETDANVDVDVLYGTNVQAYQGGGGHIGVQAALHVDGDHFGTGLVDILTGIHIPDMNASGGPATVAAGAYIENQTNGYALYTNTGGQRFGDYADLAEISTPAAPTNTHGRLFCRDNAGKTQLCIKYSDGTVHVIDSQP